MGTYDINEIEEIRYRGEGWFGQAKITGELKPGQKLNECGLSEELGISRPPLRETFRILEKDQLVVAIPRKGTYVTELSIRDFEEVCQIREMVECYVVDLLKISNVRGLPIA